MSKEKSHWTIPILSGILIGVASNILMDSFKELLPNLALRIIVLFLTLCIIGLGVWLLLKYFTKYVAQEVYKENSLNFSFLGVLGKIFHKDNIAVRIQTIQIILDNYLDTNGNNELSLKELGRFVGISALGDDSGNVRMPQESEKTPKDAIKNWLNIETHANWGEFSVSFTDKKDGKFCGRITIKKCFLVLGRIENKKDLAPFLTGYLEVIITKLAKFNVKVTEVKEGKDFGNGTCEFNFNPQ